MKQKTQVKITIVQLMPQAQASKKKAAIFIASSHDVNITITYYSLNIFNNN